MEIKIKDKQAETRIKKKQDKNKQTNTKAKHQANDRCKDSIETSG